MKISQAFTILVLSVLIAAAGFYVFKTFPMMPLAASEESHIVDHAFNGMLAATIPIFALVVSVLLVSLLWYRHRADDTEKEGSRFFSSPGHIFEILWIGASIVLTLGLAAYGSKELVRIIGEPKADLDVEVRASQWTWEFYYPGYEKYGSALNLPRGKRVRIILTSEDVVHSFWVPEFRLKQDAVPGKVIPLLSLPLKRSVHTALRRTPARDHTTHDLW